MDLSPAYTVMCDQAGDDLRDYWERRMGDFCAGDKGSRFVVTHGILAYDKRDMEPYRFEITNITGHAPKPCWTGGSGQVISSLCLSAYTWLPRVDQLISLLQGELSVTETLHDLAQFADEQTEEPETIEQSLLKMFMRRKFHKRWVPETSSWMPL